MSVGKESSSGNTVAYIIGILGVMICCFFLIWIFWDMFQSYLAWQEMVGTAGEGEYTFTVLSYAPWLVIVIIGMIVSIYIMQYGKR